jgi:hypothetical protein
MASESIAEVFTSIRSNITALPSDSQCAVCGLFDTANPEVVARMEAAGRPLFLAACRCANDAEVVERGKGARCGYMFRRVYIPVPL